MLVTETWYRPWTVEKQPDLGGPMIWEAAPFASAARETLIAPVLVVAGTS
jgi:hypothetical protein